MPGRLPLYEKPASPRPNNPFVDDLSLVLADGIVNQWNQLKLSPRAPQHKAHIQAAISKAVHEALEAASKEQA